MARRDYICCKSCGCKLVYDGYDNIRCDLETQYGTMDLICPDCLKELETKLAEREQLREALLKAATQIGVTKERLEAGNEH